MNVYTNFSVTKRFDNLKAAHRQWRHSGHCSKVHGENWAFEVTLSAPRLSKNNFVRDFGDFKEFRAVLEGFFDHTLLIDADDPERLYFEEMNAKGLAKVIFVPSASAEGLAQFVYSHSLSLEMPGVRVTKVVCYEDSKNSAVYESKLD